MMGTAPHPADAGLELFVAGDSILSLKAQANLAALVAELRVNLPITIVDARREPRIALDRRIFATPALVVTTEDRRRMVVGDLSDRKALLAALGLPAGRT